jgi:Restriction endonuclease
LAKKLNPVVVNLIYDALLKCFWRKEALKRFLRTSGISGTYIAQLDNNETKRVWLDRLFPLVSEHENGTELLLTIGRSLATMTHFHDLDGWEDSAKKREEATAAVAALAMALGGDDDRIASERSVKEKQRLANEMRQAAIREQADLESLKKRMDTLALALGTQKGGYDFQTWFFDLVDYEDIDNRRPYTVDGRQIDGSLTLDGTTYLVELKFEAKQAAAPDIDSLKAKVNSKADNTMGIMVAMSSYSSVAIAEASGPKTAVLLLDAAHIFMVLQRASTLKEIIRRVRRHSSQTGASYLPPADFGG